jgi:hypothetical protein
METLKIAKAQRDLREPGLPRYRGEQLRSGSKQVRNAFSTLSTKRDAKKCFEDRRQRVFSRQVVLGYPSENRYLDTTHLKKVTAARSGDLQIKPENNIRGSNLLNPKRWDVRDITIKDSLIGRGDNYPCDNYLDKYRS